MGELTVERRYYAGRRCAHKSVPWDQWAGVRLGHLTAQDLCFGGAGREQLVIRCGQRPAATVLWDSSSDQTIRRVSEEAGTRASSWLSSSPAALEKVQNAEGNGEMYTDGTCINTREGWREMRMNIFARRPRGPGVEPGQWADRYLPPTTARFAWAGISECHEFGRQWRDHAARLGWKEGRGLSVLADGAKWIWKQVAEHLWHSQCVVDVYHSVNTCMPVPEPCLAKKPPRPHRGPSSASWS